MQVVLDTNVLVSAFVSRGICREIVRSGLKFRQLCISEYILAELTAVLSKKLKDNEILFVDSLALSDIKTKEALKVVQSLAKATGFKALADSKRARVLTALSGRSEKTEKSFRNLPQLEIVFLKNLNPMDVLNYKYLLIENPTEAVKFLESRG